MLTKDQFQQVNKSRLYLWIELDKDSSSFVFGDCFCFLSSYLYLFTGNSYWYHSLWYLSCSKCVYHNLMYSITIEEVELAYHARCFDVRTKRIGLSRVLTVAFLIACWFVETPLKISSLGFVYDSYYQDKSTQPLVLTSTAEWKSGPETLVKYINNVYKNIQRSALATRETQIIFQKKGSSGFAHQMLGSCDTFLLALTNSRPFQSLVFLCMLTDS